MNKEKGEKENRRKALQKRMAQNKIKQLTEQIKKIERKKAELMIIGDSLDQLKGKKGEKTLIPTGAGIYLRGEIKDTKNFLVEIGGGVVKEKSFEDAKEFLEEKREEFDDRSKEIEEEIAKIQKSLA